MSTVLDTSVLIDILRGLPAALEYVSGLEDLPICSEVARVEVIRGLLSHERPKAERLFAEIDWIAVDESVARRAGELGRRWRRSHPGIGTPDLVVAATAEELGAGLGTINTRHFPMFGRLRAPY